jgi:D-aminoacyl-tRNA deacylase
MRVVLQRVSEASVTVGEKRISKIGPGLALLVGVAAEDGAADVEWIAGRILALKLMEDGGGAALSVQECGAELLCVSQFTLLASCRKGAKPSWHRAASADAAGPLFEAFCELLEARLGRPVARGEFGAHMRVSLVNDGPVTLILDSKLRE